MAHNISHQSTWTPTGSMSTIQFPYTVVANISDIAAAAAAAAAALDIRSVTQPEVVGCQTGSTTNRTASGGGGRASDACVVITPFEAFICVSLALLIVAIIVGNVFVILSVLIFDKMRTLSNGLIVSLASADLLVAIVVLPISLQHEVIGQWTLGPRVCDLWITSDVFCCTASILNIVVIALDRYWLITRHVRYTHSAILPRRRVCVAMLAMAWVVSMLISASPLLGWRRGTERLDPTECLISQDYSYTIFSTFGAFWLPLVVILAVYFKIFHFARQRATRRTKPYEQTAVEASIMMAVDNVNETICPDTPLDQLDTPFPPQQTQDDESTPPPSLTATDGGGGGGGGGGTLDPLGPPPPPTQSPPPTPTSPCPFVERQSSAATSPPPPPPPAPSIQSPSVGKRGLRPPPSSLLPLSRSRKGHRSRSMRRSARTLGLIIGGFLVCWMPFFAIATLDPFCPDCQVPRLARSFVLWLGYSNSLLNPAIYAIWDKSFRRSFKRLISCEVRW